MNPAHYQLWGLAQLPLLLSLLCCTGYRSEVSGVNLGDLGDVVGTLTGSLDAGLDTGILCNCTKVVWDTVSVT